MTWLLVALVAYFLLAGSAVLDKFILTKPVRSPWVYATYIGLLSGYAVFALPFVFSFYGVAGRWDLVAKSVASGIFNITASALFYDAIKRGEISRVAPFVGVFTALFTLLLGAAFSVEKIDLFEFFIFILLSLGALFVSRVRFDVLGFLSAFLWALSLVLIKGAYQEMSFLSAFTLARLGDFLIGVVLVSIPSIRASLKENWQNLSGKTIKAVSALKLVVGTSLIVQQYAIFLGSVVLVQALVGVQYLFIWLIVAVVAKFWKDHITAEKFPWATVAVIIGFAILSFSQRSSDLAPGLKSFGLTFSKPWAERLDLNWKEAYAAMLDDLRARKLRLPAYWNEVEKKPDVFSFADLDWQVNETKKRNAEIILAVGRRLPRWPECHIPPWAENSNIETQNSKLLEYVKTTVVHYKNESAVAAWQVENEPFLKGFGECPEPDAKLLDQEIALVKSLDKRPVIVTDSGELGSWLPSAKRADIFGTTMYSVVWRRQWPKGYIRYPLVPSLFNFKANLAGTFAGTKDIIISELQAEPWGPAMIYDLTPEEQAKSMNPKQFSKNIKLAKAVGFREAYLWGVEWMYKEKLAGRPEMWNLAKTLFNR